MGKRGEGGWWLDLWVLAATYAGGVALRLLPRLAIDPHLLTFEADIWYRLALAQYVLDHRWLPVWDLRYEAYGRVPTWYMPLGLYGFALLARVFAVDLPTVCSRILPFIEALTPLSFYIVVRALYSRRAALVATACLSLTPSFVFWSGIGSPQSATLFHVPVAILLWIRYLEGRYLTGSRLGHLGLMGGLFALNFLTHLSFFTLVLIVIFVHLGLVLEGQTTLRRLVALTVPVLVSQLVTAWWWGPPNLYWWWTQALTTSSALYEGRLFLDHYGTVAAILGHLALVALFVLVLVQRKSFPALSLLPIAWAIFPMLESHNEGILNLYGRRDLGWFTLIKPLEGFRFYCFLGPPLALCVGVVADRVLARVADGRWRSWRGVAVGAVAVALVGGLWWDLWSRYGMAGRFQNAAITKEEYDAAVWYRQHSAPTDRLVTEYFTAQLFIGVAGGRALEGSMFPLRKVEMPYINDQDGWRVQKDIYAMYTSDDPEQVHALMRLYGCTHIAFSPKILRHIEYITQGDSVLDDLHDLAQRDFSRTLFNPTYFEEVYRQGDVRILRRREGGAVGPTS